VPAINQIEVYLFHTRTVICDFCQKHGIFVEAYCPLVKALKMDDPTIALLAKKYS
jgi:diketogulonate reductase-like aldo/keto reductase